MYILLIIYETFSVITLVKTEEDKKLEKIGKYLELGGTMLAKHCECGAPLFRYHGDVICPVCDSNSSNGSDITANGGSKKNAHNTISGKTDSPITQQSMSSLEQTSASIPRISGIPGAPAVPPIFSSSVSPVLPEQAPGYEVTTSTTPRVIAPETQDFINNTIINKVVQLCLDLQRETDLGRIKQQMEAIKSGTKALKNLKKIN